MSDSPNSNTPESFEELSRSEPADKAGGSGAVVSSLKNVLQQSGLLRGGKALAMLNQKGGFDCPSCAWPDPDGKRSPSEFCENGAKAVASETTRRLVTTTFFEKYSVVELAEQSDYWHDQQGRIEQPFYLPEGETHYEPISWENAFEKIGGHLRNLGDPNEAIFYTSGRTSNEAAFLYQLFARTFGTNNLPDCSNMCHESSGLALKQSIGVAKGTVSLEDIHNAELLLIIGQNPGTNHPRMLSSLQEAKENGARIISINPLQEAGLKAFAHPQRMSQLLGGKTEIADDFICLKTNGDQALFKGVAKRILENARTRSDVLDTDFIENFANGFEVFRAKTDSEDWDELVRLSGATREQMEMLGDAFCENERIISCWAMGLTQHRNAVATIQELSNLHLMRGAIGKYGAGLCPVRGHSNVQGDRTMGICEIMPEAFHRSLESAFGIKSPREMGHHVVDAIRAMKAGNGKVFFAMGGNFLSASPDTDYTAEALGNCDLTVHVSTKLNRSHLITGKEALILPCLGRSERDEQKSGLQWITVENSMGIVSRSQGRLQPASQWLKSEVAIVCGLARATLLEEDKIDWGLFEADYSFIRDKIEEVIPGFDSFNERVSQPGGFYLYNAAKERVFETGTGKANFFACDLDIEAAKENHLLLMTIRSHDQYNTTVYGLDDRYRGVYGERRVIFMNKVDMERLDLRPEAIVDVSSQFEDETRTLNRFIALPYEIPEGCAAMYFPEANPLVPLNHGARGSFTPASKSIQIRIAQSGA
ncbi:FdhF/YdeP family oxidoreductase [Puniceicoccaceae bacterium K14]|nr:FdhF/YdeP family oxidoreductase [Puniceicoccaceae bacterium K14]